jgi:phenylalanyl-tRNA synthetase beta chain
VAEVADAHDASIHLMPLQPPPVFLAAGRAAAVIARPKRPTGTTLPGARIGVVGELAPDIAEKLELPSSVPAYVAELDLEELSRFQQALTKAAPLPRYPSVTRDISVLVDRALESARIRDTIRDAAPAMLVDVREFDLYQGKGIPEDKVSVSLRLTFRSPDRTLTDAEVQAATDRLIDELKARHDAIQR